MNIIALELHFIIYTYLYSFMHIIYFFSRFCDEPEVIVQNIHIINNEGINAPPNEQLPCHQNDRNFQSNGKVIA